MNEEKIREIVRNEMDKNYKYGAPIIPPHQHDGNDNLKITSSDVIGFSLIPSGNTLFKDRFMARSSLGFANPKVLKTPAFELENELPALYPNTVVFDNTSGLAGGFQGGYAPEGTIILFQTPLTFYQLWARIGGAWRGIDLTLSVTDPLP